MRNARAAKLAGTQFNRVSRGQLRGLGISEKGIKHLVASGRMVIVEQGVLAFTPVIDDDWGRWMGATLTAPETVLSHASAAAARKFWSRRRDFEMVTRPGNGGPKRHGGILVFHSNRLAGHTECVRGVPTTTVPRTLLDLAASVSERALARALREALRLHLASVASLTDYLTDSPGRRGVARLAVALARYSDLPIERARSGAEIRALEVLRDAGFLLPRLNAQIAGVEADLSWRDLHLIIEIDGGPFHLDRGEDVRKEAVWAAAGWSVLRISSHDVYEAPELLIALAAAANVPRGPLSGPMRHVRR